MKRTWKMPRTWDRNTIKRPLAVRLEGRKRWRAFVTRRHLAGQSIRGTALKRQHADRELHAAIDAVVTTLANNWEALPLDTKREAVRLQKQLAALKLRTSPTLVNRQS